jgi:predicted AlkP superfamily phosphohydrolase/phosphomutase
MLLIVGLDGATLDLARPWAAAGDLPELAGLMDSGAWGELQSTVPPTTLPGWTTFMTGVNPGRHGIFDFTRRKPGSYGVRFVNSTFCQAPSIWRLLSDAGKRVAVLGLPGTYPPEPVNGCMISGFDTPVTTRADRSFVYPPSFAAAVEEMGGFPFADFQEFRIGPGWHERALGSLHDGIERKVHLAERLLDRQPWDCLMLLFGESDSVAHHFWGFHDGGSPFHEPHGAAGLRDAVRSIYVALDRAIGRLREHARPARVLVASDHGFGGAGDRTLYLNRWLEEKGWLAWKRRGAAARSAAWLRSVAVQSVPERWQASLFRMGRGRLADALESRVRFGGLDWARTRAFSEELNSFPSIWLNVEGREPRGTVPRERYRESCERLSEELRAWRDPHDGGAVVRRVWLRDELYRGFFVENAPDLVLDLSTPGGYSYVCLSSRARSGRPIVRLERQARSGGKLSGMSGSHRPNGLFVLAGEGIRSGRLEGARIADMAPTILALCEVPIPEAWDGSVLPCVEAEVRRGSDARGERRPEAPYGEAEEAEIAARLARLGYLQ